MEFSEKEIIQSLNYKYAGNCKYKMSCIFVFKYDWESDFFVLKQNGYAYEIEIKISKSDFNSDKKKVSKHHALRFVGNGGFVPNKFYYIVPKNLISISEIPTYAGLMYIDELNQIEIIKDAPFIHKNILSFEKILCPKFYHKMIDYKIKARNLERELEYLKSKLENIEVDDI